MFGVIALFLSEFEFLNPSFFREDFFLRYILLSFTDSQRNLLNYCRYERLLLEEKLSPQVTDEVE